jgi:hypothetical protein
MDVWLLSVIFHDDGDGAQVIVAALAIVGALMLMSGCEFTTTGRRQLLRRRLCSCPSYWLADGECDSSCNNYACNYDRGDCANSYYSTPSPPPTYTFKDETYTTTGLVALILTAVSLFYGIYMIVAGCTPVS